VVVTSYKDCVLVKDPYVLNASGVVLNVVRFMKLFQ